MLAWTYGLIESKIIKVICLLQSEDDDDEGLAGYLIAIIVLLCLLVVVIVVVVVWKFVVKPKTQTHGKYSILNDNVSYDLVLLFFIILV